SALSQGDVWINANAFKWRGASATLTAVDTNRTITATSPLTGGGNFSADRTISCALCEITTAKNIASGYAGLDSASRIAKAQGHAATVYNDQANTYSAGVKQTFR